MANTTFSFPKSVSLVDYQDPFITGSQLATWDWQPIVTMKTTNRLTEQVFSYAGFGLPTATSQGQPFYYADMAELGATTFTMVKYTLATRFYYEVLKYDWHIRDLMGKSGREMGRSHAQLRDSVVAQIFNRLTNSTTQPMYDGAAMAATHTMNYGGTVLNLLTAASLNFDNLWSAVNYFSTTMYDHAGKRIVARPAYVVTHPQNEKLLEKILRSDKEPDTADNQINTLARKGLRPIYCPFLTSTTQWTVLSEDFKNDVWFFNVEDPRFDQDDDFDIHASKIRSWQIFTVYPKEFVNLVHNVGA